MAIDPRSMRALTCVAWVLIIGGGFYNVYGKYHTLAACQSQQAQMDVIEKQLDDATKQIDGLKK
jgi:hypothetical protein